jgi:hypothetical protein
MGSTVITSVKIFFASKQFAQNMWRNRHTGELESDPLDKTCKEKIKDFVNDAFTEPDIPFLWKEYVKIDDLPSVSVVASLYRTFLILTVGP